MVRPTLRVDRAALKRFERAARKILIDGQAILTGRRIRNNNRSIDMTTAYDAPPRTEEHKVEGEKLLAKVKELIHQGNIRRITIQDSEGHPIIEIPLTIGVVGAVLLPIWVAVGAIAALAADYKLVVEKLEET
jgi:Domain of unknown function (DUF4342)